MTKTLKLANSVAIAIAWMAIGVHASAEQARQISLAEQATRQKSLAIPTSILNADDEAWVPVMMLADHAAKSDPNKPVLLGLAQVKDIEDGFPYKVGLYQVKGNLPLGYVLSSGLSAQLSAGKVTLAPVCSRQQALPTSNCEPLVGLIGSDARSSAQGGSIAASYQLGPLQLNAGVFGGDRAYTQMLNPYLPFSSSSTLTLLNGAGSQTGLSLGSALQSNFGQFGLDLSLAKTPLPPFLTQTTRAPVLNESQLSFSWLTGSLSTQLSSRLNQVNGKSWGGLDLGLTWRTPWQGSLSFGARNVVVSGKPPTYLDPERAIDAVETDRVPYIRYEQDL
jgi:hypothetical protein